MGTWRDGLVIGAIYELDEVLLNSIGSYTQKQKDYVSKFKHILSYQLSGDCFTSCLLIKKNKKGFKGTDIDKNSFGFYAGSNKILYKCTLKEMSRLMAGMSITTKAY